MPATARTTNASIAFTARPFRLYHVWMTLTRAQLINSLPHLFDIVCDEVSNEHHVATGLKLIIASMDVSEFEDAPKAMWAQRTIGIGGDSSYLVEYEVVVEGNGGRCLAKGTLRFK